MILSRTPVPLLLTMAIAHGATAQLLQEDFSTPVGTALTAAGWAQSGSTATNPILTSTAGGLSYPSYGPSGAGNAATLATSGQDVYRSFPAVSSGSIYLSFMVNVASAQSGDYCIALSPSSNQLSYHCRVFLKSATGGFLIGLAKSNEPTGPTYGSNIIPFTTTCLVVARYTFVAADTADDVLRLYLFAATALPPEEPSVAEVGPYLNAKDDPADLGTVTMRQGSASAAPALIVDGIRVSTTWADVTLSVQLATFSGNWTTNGVELSWSTLTEINNYGFEVQKSETRTGTFQSVSGLIPGHGTTNLPQAYAYIDSGNDPGRFYRLKQIDLDQRVHFSEPIEVAGTTGIAESKPYTFALEQNFPNPFNPTTRIRYRLEAAARIRLAVLDLLGREVAVIVNGSQAAGEHDALWDAAGRPSGVYFCRLSANGRVAVRTMLLVR
ncbi:MAG: T9SS type A sorting domain-containing protein [Bacteroidota bacterium]